MLLVALLAGLSAMARAQDASAAPPAWPESLQRAYDAKRPSRLLHDPQGLLGASETAKQLEFLNYHAGDSAIDLQFYLFKADDVIEDNLDAGSIMGRFYKQGKPTVVVFYHLGAPERSQLLLSPELETIVPESRRASSLKQAVAKAAEDPTAAGQMEKFAVQMSMQIYWMEKLLEQHRQRPQGAAQVVPQDAAPVPAEGEGYPAGLLEGLRRERDLLVTLAVVPGVLLLLLLVLRWRRSRLRFVDIGVEARLGGQHAAHCGSVISFASAARPLSRQK